VRNRFAKAKSVNASHAKEAWVDLARLHTLSYPLELVPEREGVDANRVFQFLGPINKFI